mmetsp:Transcript_25530/g.41200  ORF Transcript_25530/g.41200 Transcript_25530/m.41200 type:complete len:416 (-) Transcript_25530:81-1328(-)
MVSFLPITLLLLTQSWAVLLSDQQKQYSMGGIKKHRHAGPSEEYYHTRQSILTELEKMSTSENCKNIMTISKMNSGNVTLQKVDFHAEGGQAKKMKVLVYFGEHARELVSPESGLNFAQHLCGMYSETKEKATSLLQFADVRMIPVVNPTGHDMVMLGGNLCHRTNSKGVDLNRNWDDHWRPNKRADTNSGIAPFSEHETQLLRDDAMKYKPHVFLTIHSGTLGLFTPYAFAQSSANPSSLLYKHSGPSFLSMQSRMESDDSSKARIKEMINLLDGINPKYCNCEAGAAGDVLPYLSPGTSMDYMFDKLGTDYAFAFEIYDGASSGGYKYNSKDVKLIQTGVLQRRSDFLLVEETQEPEDIFEQSNDQAEQCFEMFNPETKTEYDATMDNWSKAYLELFEGLISIEKSHGMFKMN